MANCGRDRSSPIPNKKISFNLCTRILSSPVSMVKICEVESTNDRHILGARNDDIFWPRGRIDCRRSNSIGVLLLHAFPPLAGAWDPHARYAPLLSNLGNRTSKFKELYRNMAAGGTNHQYNLLIAATGMPAGDDRGSRSKDPAPSSSCTREPLNTSRN